MINKDIENLLQKNAMLLVSLARDDIKEKLAEVDIDFEKVKPILIAIIVGSYLHILKKVQDTLGKFGIMTILRELENENNQYLTEAHNQDNKNYNPRYSWDTLLEHFGLLFYFCTRRKFSCDL